MGRLLPMMAYFACSSVVLFLSFAEKFDSESQIFLQKDVQFRPAGRRYPPSNAGSSATCQHWPFRGVHSCRVVRGPNFHRVMRVHYSMFSRTCFLFGVVFLQCRHSLNQTTPLDIVHHIHYSQSRQTRQEEHDAAQVATPGSQKQI